MKTVKIVVDKENLRTDYRDKQKFWREWGDNQDMRKCKDRQKIRECKPNGI